MLPDCSLEKLWSFIFFFFFFVPWGHTIPASSPTMCSCPFFKMWLFHDSKVISQFHFISPTISEFSIYICNLTSRFAFEAFVFSHLLLRFPWWLSGKEPAWNAGDAGSVSGLERLPGEGHGNSLQYCCLENPVDRGPMGSWRIRHSWSHWAYMHTYLLLTFIVLFAFLQSILKSFVFY